MLMLSFIVTNSKGLSFKWKKKCFSVNWIVGAKSPVIMLQSSKCINVMKRCLESTMTSVRSTWHVSLISLHHLPRWACCLGKSDSASSADSFFFVNILYTCLLFTERVTAPACLNSCVSDGAPLPNRDPETDCVLLPVRGSFACETCMWPDAQHLLGLFE